MHINKKALLISGGGLVAAAVLLADSSWLTGSTDDKFNTLANIQPGLGTVMIEYSNRFTNVYYAVQAGNWGFAAYQLKEMPEIQEVGETTRPARADALKGFENSMLTALANDIVNMDAGKFNTDFTAATAFCNACHQAAGFDYIKYQLPDHAPAPVDMSARTSFSSDELRNILSALLP